MSIFHGAFWRAAAERAFKAFAYSASAVLIGNGTGLLDSDWTGVLSVAGMAAVLSMLGSVASDAATGGTGPSLTSSETLTTTVATSAPQGADVYTEVALPDDGTDDNRAP